MAHTGEINAALGSAIDVVNNGSGGAGSTTFNLDLGMYHKFTCTGATRTINAPTKGGAAVSANAQFQDGTLLFVDITNSSGGALTITWSAAFRQAATAPASTKRRVYSFAWDGGIGKWVQVTDGVDT